MDTLIPNRYNDVLQSYLIKTKPFVYCVEIFCFKPAYISFDICIGDFFNSSSTLIVAR